MTTRSLSFGARTYPVVLPSIRDPRLHVAAVIITIHVLGQVALHFRVSVPQILAAILTCAIIEISITYRERGAIVWPASAMLTGSGVALILRAVGTPANSPWTTDAWWLFATVAGLSLLSKYVLRYRGAHLFNPSNVGLVAAFLVLGLTRVEPLDFWWAPLEPPMITAYIVIVAGGLLITRRLHLLALAATYWLTLAAGVGVLAASGHCMIANWAFAPVCGVDFWRVIVTSPEVLIFLFFMITDPRTVPAGRVGRVAFGLIVAIASTLLMAPQTDEFGTKVALLASLVLVCAARPTLDRLMPVPRSANDGLRPFVGGLVLGRGPTGRTPATARRLAGIGLAVLATMVVGAGIVVAGTPARGLLVGGPEVGDGMTRDIDPSTFPAITVAADVIDFDHTVDGTGAQQILVTLAQNLEIENQALLGGDAALLAGVDHGDRLAEMRARIAADTAAGRIELDHYRFSSVHVILLVPFGAQTGVSLGFQSQGTRIVETYDAGGVLQGRRSEPFDLTFAVRRVTGDRWLTVAVLPAGAGG